MASVNGLTKERMLEIEAASIVGGEIVGDNLILTKHDTTTIDAGNVRGPEGPTGPPGDVNTATLNAAILAALPVGVSLDYIESTAPAGWLAMIGQTVVDGQTLYPLLWAKLPASAKSGANIILPDTRGRVVVGYNSSDTDFDTIAETGGAKTHVLTQAELPAATISIDPPSTTVSVNPPSTTFSIDPPSTSIVIDPPSTASYNADIDHYHFYKNLNSHNVAAGTGATAFYSWSTGNVSTSSDGGTHAHYVNIPAFNATVDIPAFNATVDIAAFNVAVDIASFNSGNLGSGDGHTNMQPYIVMLKIIKAL